MNFKLMSIMMLLGAGLYVTSMIGSETGETPKPEAQQSAMQTKEETQEEETQGEAGTSAPAAAAAVKLTEAQKKEARQIYDAAVIGQLRMGRPIVERILKELNSYIVSFNIKPEVVDATKAKIAQFAQEFAKGRKLSQQQKEAIEKIKEWAEEEAAGEGKAAGEGEVEEAAAAKSEEESGD